MTLDSMKEEILMAITAAEQALVDAFNTATTKVGDRIARLLAAEPNITPEGKAALEEVIATLNVLGTDPNNPVPPDAMKFKRGRP